MKTCKTEKKRSRLLCVVYGAALGLGSLAWATTGFAESDGKKPRPTRLPSVEKPLRLPAVDKPTRLPAPDLTARMRSLKVDEEGIKLVLSPPVATGTDTDIPDTDFDWIDFNNVIESALASSTLNAASEESVPSPSDSFSELPIGCQIQDPYYNDFSPTPLPSASMLHDSEREQWVYDAKHDVPTQHPWIEWGRIFYGDGITPRGRNWFGKTNMVRPKLYVYGDFRSGIAAGRNAAGRTDNWANRLNLDIDLQVTDAGRFHSFVGPIDKNGAFTRWERVAGDYRFRDEIDFTPLTGFYEGDVGAMLGGLMGTSSPFELPITLGLVPLLFQNGIWMEDAVTGGAFSLPARHSRLLNWSNYDATFFAVFDQLNSAAFGADEHAAQAFGTAWFIEAYGGYIETGYAYVRDRNNDAKSYHNMTASFTRRYFDRISNSVRVIINSGQDLAKADRTADGGLFLFENSLITANPLTVVPYANFFYGWDRPQSVARAGVSGGILRNTGINFDTDGLNGFATLDPTAADTAGGSVGVDLIGKDLDQQWLVEVSYVTPHGDKNPLVPADQFATGTRYQFPISNRSLLRFDAMYGWRRDLVDVYGTRMEYRWKF
ncbi:hypothetical protein Poly51_44310 [Rubripirellula tenax]|uniref:Capsule assembly protein Wzi n=1 Tax=Rubripirellula tenax TaxID=2528015 RepID=A0A5C6ELQ8_9BACT|nr:hypothetical protein [Rubripirellula tenax]TWU48531.1 hypothetical protein Poly51_44310 [Rubripirellula tenax]